jgi:hypothetical protein
MNAKPRVNFNFDTLAWGFLFIWWGLTELFPALPAGVGAVGIGVILLGVNAARVLSGVPTSGFSIALGVLALVWGGLELAGALLKLPFELPIFPILLIVLGVIILLPKMSKNPSLS